MSETQHFREQHEEMLQIASKILAQLSIDKLTKDAGEVRSLLSTLLGKLSVHLVMEDKSLYPHLLEHPDEQIKSVTAEFIDEMGNIGKLVTEYKNKWPSKSAIEKNPAGFIEETRVILNALANRIKKENNELYKLVDEL